MFLVLALALPRDLSAFGPVPLHFVRCQACRPASPAGKFERSPCPEHSECVPFDDERGCRLSRLQWRSAGLLERQQLNRLRCPRLPPPQTTRTGVQVNGKQGGEVSSNARLESSGRRTRIPSTSRGAVWTGEPTDPARERRRSGLLGRLSRGWFGSKSVDAASADRAWATAGSGGASRNAKAEAAESPAQSTNPARGTWHWSNAQDRDVSQLHDGAGPAGCASGISLGAPTPFSGAACWRSCLGRWEQCCVRESGQSILRRWATNAAAGIAPAAPPAGSLHSWRRVDELSGSCN